jgi:hypothetical protein
MLVTRACRNSNRSFDLPQSQELQLPPYFFGKSSPMALRQRLAVLIWAAVLVIAAQFVAGSAWAHSGHSLHHSAAAHSAGQLPHNGETASKAQHTASNTAEVSVSTVDRGEPPASPQSGGCTGGCCGHGVGCCGAVLAASSSSLSNFPAPLQIVSIGFEHGSGLDPEALARPPRTLA